VLTLANLFFTLIIMKRTRAYTIKFVARQTGIKPYLIRTWEARYRAICPERTDSNRRVFCDEDIKRLALLKQAVEAGHAISSVANMSDAELKELLKQSDVGTSTDVPSHPDSVDASGDAPANVSDTLDSALSHITNLDAASLERVLSDAAVDMPRHAFLQLLILPMFEKVGELWRTGNLKIINEHMASMVVRSLLWDMLRSVTVSKTAPRIVVATPVGHWHEFGALVSALSAAESGWQVAYFGPDLPSEEIAYAVRRVNAKALALSLCHRLNDQTLSVELVKIRRLVGSSLPIFIGGPGTAAARRTIAKISAIEGNDLGKFRDRLEAMIASED
jgi:DNA-binding transcriptional MerR regulator/methylmalonyl-CoA mutase cobalamin-binding subunit